MKVQARLQPLFISVIAVVLSTSAVLQAQWVPMNPIREVQQTSDGVTFSMGTGTLKVLVCSESIIHVMYSPTTTFPTRADYVVIKESWPTSKWTMQSSDDAVTISTTLLKVTVARKDGAISYADLNGNPLVTESSRKMTA